jgi:lysozyme family protein
MASPGSHALTMVIWAVALALLWYAARKRSEGVLR